VRRDLLEADERVGGQQLGGGVENPLRVAASVSSDVWIL
jgi:hypothetical protein